MHFRSLLYAAILLFSFSSGLNAASIQVVASVRPVTLLVSELTQFLPIEVQTLLPRGATPHDYALKLSDIRALQQADLVIWLGPASEPYLVKAMTHADQQMVWEALPGLKLLPLRSALHRVELHELDGQHEHHHGNDHSHDDHGHGSQSADPHFWLSIPNALVLLNSLHQKLVQLYPEGELQLDKNKQAVEQQLKEHLKKSKEVLDEQSSPFILAHDAYQYLEQDLSIQSLATVVLDPEVKPGIKHILTLKKWVNKQNVSCVITDPTVSSGLLAKIDSDQRLKRVAIDPLGWDFEGEKFSLWQAKIYQKVERCLAQANNL